MRNKRGFYENFQQVMYVVIFKHENYLNVTKIFKVHWFLLLKLQEVGFKDFLMIIFQNNVLSTHLLTLVFF